MAKKRDPIHAASHSNDSATLEELLKAGASCDARDTSQRTPLHAAAAQGHVQACAILLRHGASASAEDKAGKSPAGLCVDLSVSGNTAKRPNFIKILSDILVDRDEVACPARDQSRQTWLTSLLHHAARDGAREAAAVLIQHGARDGIVDHHKSTALHIASAGGDITLVTLLLEAEGASSTALQDNKGNTPLHLAADAGHAPAVRAILDRSRNPRPLNALGRTPLALALARGHTPVIAVFVEHLMTPHLPPAAPAAAEAAAVPRPRRRGVGGRWARHAMRDDVADAQISQITQEILKSKGALDRELCAAAEATDFVLLQLLIDCGAPIAVARSRRRGVVSLALLHVMESATSFEETLVWWPEVLRRRWAATGDSGSQSPPPGMYPTAQHSMQSGQRTSSSMMRSTAELGRCQHGPGGADATVSVGASSTC